MTLLRFLRAGTVATLYCMCTERIPCMSWGRIHCNAFVEGPLLKLTVARKLTRGSRTASIAAPTSAEVRKLTAATFHLTAPRAGGFVWRPDGRNIRTAAGSGREVRRDASSELTDPLQWLRVIYSPRLSFLGMISFVWQEADPWQSGWTSAGFTHTHTNDCPNVSYVASSSWVYSENACAVATLNLFFLVEIRASKKLCTGVLLICNSNILFGLYKDFRVEALKGRSTGVSTMDVFRSFMFSA